MLQNPASAEAAPLVAGEEVSAPARPEPTVATRAEVRDPVLVRLSLGYVFFHFGFLKFFHDLSTAEWIAELTITKLSWYFLSPGTTLYLLATMEVFIGLCLLLKLWLRPVVVLFFAHMLGTFLPVLFSPEYVFRVFPLGLTFEGQYVLKNVVFIAAAWTCLVPYAFQSKRTKLSNQETQS